MGLAVPVLVCAVHSSGSGSGSGSGAAALCDDSLETLGGVTLLGQSEATQLDVDLMSPEGGFSIDQLMELAGLSCAAAAVQAFPAAAGHRNVLVVCGPGNNGGDGLVAARHLHHFGYTPVVVYPKRGRAQAALFAGLTTQLAALGVPVVATVGEAHAALLLRAAAHTQAAAAAAAAAVEGGGEGKKSAAEAAEGLASFDCAIDAIFGFSFKGTPRAPFDGLLGYLKTAGLPLLSIDVPSGWDVERGDLSAAEGAGEGGTGLRPDHLISLTAPKKCAALFTGRHWLGGRFVPPPIAEKYGLELPPYPGTEQVVELKGWSTHTSTASCGGGKEAGAAEGEAPTPTAIYEASPQGEFAVVWVTAPAGGDKATVLATTLVKSRLAACVNIVPSVTSVYEWQGAVETEAEALLMVKTRAAHLPELAALIKTHHGYEVPETIAAGLVGGNRAYLQWLRDNTKEVEANRQSK